MKLCLLTILPFDGCEDCREQVVVGTVHQAKGAEFDYVMLGSDFLKLSGTTSDKPDKISLTSQLEGLNIIYVATTRARKLLIPNLDMCKWLDRALVGPQLSDQNKLNLVSLP